MGYSQAAWEGTTDLGNNAMALKADYANKTVYETTSNYVAIARHDIAGSMICQAAKVWKWTTADSTFKSHFTGTNYGTSLTSATSEETYSYVPSGLENKDKDPFFGNLAGNLVINYRYSNNGVRVVVDTAYGYPTTSNSDSIKGLGNTLSACTASGCTSSSGWYHDVSLFRLPPCPLDSRSAACRPL